MIKLFGGRDSHLYIGYQHPSYSPIFDNLSSQNYRKQRMSYYSLFSTHVKLVTLHLSEKRSIKGKSAAADLLVVIGNR